MSFTFIRPFKVTLLSLVLLSPLMLQANTIPENARLDVELALPKIATSMYARPYVAVWIEDENNKPIRTLQLWIGKDEWLKDLRSWWRKAGRYDATLVDAVTSATRPAGLYRFVWDGLDDQGKRVQQGEYTFYVEVVREHGGRNYLRQKLQLQNTAFTHQLAATEETGTIVLNYKIQN